MNKNKLLSAMLAVSIVTANVAASGMTVYADGAGTNSKEEVVYIMTDAKGNVSNVNVVNIFGKGNVTDYGNYSNVKMLNTTDNISISGDKVTFNTDMDKVYYQGTMENVQIPWNITFTYILDGKTITPEQLAGKSGRMEIRINIDKNDKAAGDFYDNYALQASLSLDTDKCKNIVADGATLANVGADKQISYTVLPGKGLDAVITADVTDFEMDAASINGVMLNLDIDIDDAELMDKVTEIMDASKSINDGASTLNDGISTLNDGVVNMQEALNTLNGNSAQLTDGSAQMLDALKKIQSELDKVSMSTEQIKQLTNSSSAIKNGINEAYAGSLKLQSSMGYDTYVATLKSKGLDISAVQNGNTATIQQLTSQIQTLSAQAAQLKNVPGQESTVAQLETMIESYTDIVTLLTGNNAAITGTEQYFSALSSGSSELVNGLAKLSSSYAEFDNAINKLASSLSEMIVKMSTLKSGINEMVGSYTTLDTGINDYTDGVASIVAAYAQLVSGTDSLMNGSAELSDGTGEFYEQTDGMDGKIRDSIDEMISSISGGDAEVVSFVSDKNENVSSVQFVIKTSAIEKAEAAQEDGNQEPKLNIWQKFLKLFGVKC